MSQKNTTISTSKFQLGGKPSMKEAVPLDLQHVLAIFVGNIAPMILVASMASLSVRDVNILLQCCVLRAAISTAIQSYPIQIGSIQIGSGLPRMMGFTYVLLPACPSTTGSKGIPYISGAQVVAGVIAISYGILLKRMSSFSPPVVTGVIVMTVGVSASNLTIGNIVSGTSSPDFGAPINWIMDVFVVLVVLGLDALGEGLPKIATILIGMMANYILPVTLGLVSFSGIGEAAWFAVPKPFAFGIKFDLGYILMFVLSYFIVAVQMIGNFDVSCAGGLDRESTPDKIGREVAADGTASTIPATLNGFPTATHSQNSGIVALTKVCSRLVILVDCGVLFLASLCPKAGAALSTIPNCIAGGGTVVIFTMIATSGMKLPAKAGYSNRSYLVINVSPTLGLGTQSYEGTSAQFPAGITAVLEENNAVPISLLAIILNLVFPKDLVVAAKKEGKAQ